jgi:hypothetical protein
VIVEDNKERKKKPVFVVGTSYARGWLRDLVDDGTSPLQSLEAEGNQVKYMESESPATRNKKEEFQNSKARRRGKCGGFE